MIHSIISKDGAPFDEADAIEALTFADAHGAERRTVVRNRLLTATLKEYHYDEFGVMWQRYTAKGDGELTVRSEVKPALLLSVADGCAFSQRVATQTVPNGEVDWRNGFANINRLGGEGCITTQMVGGKTIGLFNVVVPDESLASFLAHTPQLWESLDRYRRNPHGSFFTSNRPLPTPAMKAVCDIHRCRLLGDFAHSYVEAKVLEVLYSLLSSEAGGQSFDLSVRHKAHDVLGIIHSQYKDLPSLHALATMVGTNECTLKQAFKHEFGTTIFQYLFDYRMSLAQRYLLDTSLPIQTVAIRLGYDYQSHFCTAFKRKYGVSPSQFRSQRRKNPI